MSIRMAEMIREKDVISKIYLTFKEEIKGISEEKWHENRTDELECAIQIALSYEFNQMTDYQKKVVNAFFDTYIGAWFDAGKGMANVWADAILKAPETQDQ